MKKTVRPSLSELLGIRARLTLKNQLPSFSDLAANRLVTIGRRDNPNLALIDFNDDAVFDLIVRDGVLLERFHGRQIKPAANDCADAKGYQPPERDAAAFGSVFGEDRRCNSLIDALENLCWNFIELCNRNFLGDADGGFFA